MKVNIVTLFGLPDWLPRWYPRKARAAVRRVLAVLDQLIESCRRALDEYVEHKVFAPFFGRPVRPEGNIAHAARLATLADAVLIPAYSLRLDGAIFRMSFFRRSN